MFARLRSLFPALAVGLAASEQKAPPEAWRLSYPAPLVPRPQKSSAAGISPAVRGPHSEPKVHVRASWGQHFWFTEDEWARDTSTIGEHPFDVVERINGYGQVTNRHRVAG